MDSISTLGSHSALDICLGAKKQGFRTIVVAKRGREKTYANYFFSRGRVGVVDEVIVLEDFKKIVEVQEKLKNSVFVPHRSFCVYVGYEIIEREFRVPIFGNRFLLKAEERWAPKNQYYLLKRAGIKMPKTFGSPSEIDRLCIVKVSEEKRKYERAFFLASSEREFWREARKMIKKGIISEKALENARIEEFLVGPVFNLNFFYSPILKRLELLGVDMRRQTNFEGIVRLPYGWQKKVLKHVGLKFIEAGHIACTLRESLLEKAFRIGEKLVKVCKREYKPGIIGPFALQTVLVPEDEKEDFYVFDVSFRIPGSPGTKYTPYSAYLFRKELSFGERIALEIKSACELGMLEKVVT